MTKPAPSSVNIYQEIYSWAKELFPICRSLTGEGTRQTLRYFKRILPQMKIYEVPSGTKAFDWEVPPEWNIRDAYIKDQNGQKIVDFADHNLHLVGYSEPIDEVMSLERLQEHLHSREDRPHAIPYVTSYYKRNWGFCLPHAQRENLKPGDYHVHIDSTLEPGSMTYGELILKGREEREVLLSTYICHPSLGNDEISGPVVTAALARWLAAKTDRRLTYRIVFVPETIGSIVYLSRNLEEMKRNTDAGFVLTCVGDDRAYSFLPSRQGDTLADRVARHALRHQVGEFNSYSFMDRGSDERQYCSVGVDLPVASLMRSKYHEYPEYHTSDDDLNLISPEGLGGAFELYRTVLLTLEHNKVYRTTVCCEPQLGKRGLYPTLSTVEGGRGKRWLRVLRNILAYADGTMDLIALANRIEASATECIPIIDRLLEENLLEEISQPGL